MARTTKRRQRRHGALPAGFVWGEGKPRWRPSPTRRAQGWRDVALKDAWGRWLDKGPAITRAEAIAAAVEAWAADGEVPSEWAAIAPKGVAKSARRGPGVSPRSIGALMDEYFENVRFTRRAPATQRDYRGKLSRFLEVLAGSADPAKIAKVRGYEIDILLPPPPGQGEHELQRAYDVLARDVGLHMAAGVHAAVSAWLTWVVKTKRLWPTNPAALVQREAVHGRIVVWEWTEVVAAVTAAEALGLPSIGDAIVLAIDLSFGEQDLLALTWGAITPDSRVKHRRLKTGVTGAPPLLGLGKDRLEKIKARKPGVAPLPAAPVLVCELTGRPWKADHFRHKFAEVRALAAQTLPDMASRQFRDLRDTAITYAYEAGLEIPEICSRSLHAPTRAQAVIQAHYGAIRQAVADTGAAKLEAHFQAMGYVLEGAREA